MSHKIKDLHRTKTSKMNVFKHIPTTIIRLPRISITRDLIDDLFCDELLSETFIMNDPSQCSKTELKSSCSVSIGSERTTAQQQQSNKKEPLPESVESQCTITQHKQKDKKGPLPESFQPSSYTVVLGRGNTSFKSVGYQRLQVIIGMHLKKYSKSTSRTQKSFIVSTIIDMIKDGVGDDGCPFVRFDENTKRWYEIDERTYRERVGSMIRDRLHLQFPSSNRAKLARRQAKRKNASKTTPS